MIRVGVGLRDATTMACGLGYHEACMGKVYERPRKGEMYPTREIGDCQCPHHVTVRHISYDHLKSDGRVVRITVAICDDHLDGLRQTHLVPVVSEPEQGTCDWCVGRGYREVTHR